MSDESEALALFLRDAPAAIARMADPALEATVPEEYRSAARSVARQAAGGWTVELTDDEGFAVASAIREFRVARSFGQQCRRVADMVLSVRNPDVRAAIARLGDVDARRAAVLSGFFHYFAAHEFIHVEQGLGSDQYKDSDSYMPIVMEADHVADVAGLVLALHCGVPALAPLDMRDRVLLLIAIHLASMHSFGPDDDGGVDAYAFSRLLTWYLHFARFTKATAAPDFSSPAFFRAWTVTLPRLIGREDQRVTLPLLEKRRLAPHDAKSDVVLGYHHEDGIYRIHRAALTDSDRVSRLVAAIVDARFDDVRIEFEELLVNNPALVPQERRQPAVEWAAGAVLERLERVGAGAGVDADVAAVRSVREAYDRLRGAARPFGRIAPDLMRLVDEGDAILDDMEDAAPRGGVPLSRLRRRMLSTVDQIAIGVD